MEGATNNKLQLTLLGDSPKNCTEFVDKEIRPCIADPKAIKTILFNRADGKVHLHSHN